MNSVAATVSKWNFQLGKGFWITLGVVCWLYFVISQIPASWGAYAMARSGNLAFTGTTGTLWSGRASLASIRVQGVDHSLGQLRWKLDVGSLLMLKPCAHINTQMDNQQFDGRVCVKKGTIMLSDASISFPAALIQQALPLQFDGQFSLQIEHLVVADKKLGSLKARASVQGAKVYNGANWMTLGGFGADLADDGKQGLSAHIFDVNSPVHLDMELNLPYPNGGSARGAMDIGEDFLKESNAGAWLAMFTRPLANDGKGHFKYAIDMNF